MPLDDFGLFEHLHRVDLVQGSAQRPHEIDLAEAACPPTDTETNTETEIKN
jgi:hypothetical protein